MYLQGQVHKVYLLSKSRVVVGRKVSKEPQRCNASGRTLRIADVERAGSDRIGMER